MKNRKLPSDNLIMSLLNNETDCRERLLEHYEPFIKTAAVITIYDAFGKCKVEFSEDLSQEMRIALVRGVSNWRETIFSKKKTKEQTVIVITE